jgi:hypothetical protein
MSSINETAPARVPAATEAKTIFSLLKRRSLHTTIWAFVQEYGPHFLIGAGSAALTSDVTWAIILWVRS